jgi:SAM-dependent methyltransferase
MAMARNQPCPCGSGRKYKRCCGSPLRHSAQADPADAQARFDLGCALVHAGQPLAALAHLRAAIRSAPRAGRAWQWLADALAQLRFDAGDAQAEGELVECLARPDIEPVYLAPVAASLLRADPSFRSLLPPRRDDPARALPLDEAVLRRLARPLFLRLLENTFIPEPDFEGLVATIRRAALLAWRARSLPSAGNAALRELLGALAHQCFLTQYLHEERADEAPLVDELAAGVEAALAKGGPVNEAEIALFACYRPLGTLARADALPASSASIMGRLVLRQVREPAEEAGIAARLARLTPISDEVSRAVQAQYEHHPYPRWLRTPSAEGASAIALRLRKLFPHAGAAAVVPQRPSMLIAGCGTGRHAAMCAALDPDSRILAVDLSRSSLAYAARRASESGLGNVEFAQADILELGALRERFDIIQCSGVLHHLRDPVAGLRVLAGLLAPGGKVKLGLYSEIARRGVAAARRLIAERGFAADPGGMRAARAAILALPPGDPARDVAASIDFHSLSGCRDLLFHVQERRFTLAQIATMLGELGLEFLGFEFEFAAPRLRYLREFPLDPAATSLANWAQFEARHPDTFAAMYQFWVTPKAAGRA